MSHGPLNLNLMRLQPQYDVVRLLTRDRLNKRGIGWTIPKEGAVFDATVRPLPLSDVPDIECPMPVERQQRYARLS